VVGLTAALDQLLAAGLDRIQHHAAGLRSRLLEVAATHGWQPFRAIEDPAATAHIVSLTSPREAGAAVVARLRNQGIVCSARGDRLRVSLAPYDDEDDIAALGAALA